MKLEVIITTMDEKIVPLINQFHQRHPDVSYLISHQITKMQENLLLPEIHRFLQYRSDVRYVYSFDKGLSKNRNFSMKEAQGDYCLVTDDDIKFKPGAFDNIIAAFKANPNAGIITFKTEFPDGSPYKWYWKKNREHNYRTSMRVTSFEIAYCRKLIEHFKLIWDERFGLGGDPYTNHMENIFMVDALNIGIKAYFEPKTIAIHPFDNSGFHHTEYMIFSKGAAFCRMFGKWSRWLNLLYSIKKYKTYSDEFSLVEFNRIAKKGALDFRARYK